MPRKTMKRKASIKVPKGFKFPKSWTPANKNMYKRARKNKQSHAWALKSVRSWRDEEKHGFYT